MTPDQLIGMLSVVQQKTGQSPEDLLTIAEVARQLGVVSRTVLRWEQAGRIRSIRTLGGHRRFRRADIDALLAPSSSPEQ